MRYSLEYLIQKFQEHAVQAQKQQEELLQKYIENNPGHSLPEHFLDDFSLPLALASLCKEIQEVKKRLEITDHEGYYLDPEKHDKYHAAVEKFLRPEAKE